MNDFKTQVFIGSSMESLHVAKQIEQELDGFADCKIWTGQFEFGNSAYEDLVNNLALYDYGILVAASDDLTKSRGEEKKSPRDNVIFEFGLFAGRMGRKRSFLMVESGIKLPSDLSGITLPFYKSSKKKGILDFRSPKVIEEESKKSISICSSKIRSYIESRDNIFDYGFLPSTSLAYGYFNNFILKAVSNLLETKILRLGNTCNFPRSCQKENSASPPADLNVVDGMEFRDLELTILIPDDLTSDMFDKVRSHRSSGDWKVIKIDAGSFRPFDFYIQAEKSNQGVLYLSDIPITLNALNDSIRSYIGKSYIGYSDAERLLEMREIRVFKRVLEYLINSNSVTRDRVKIELVDI